MTIFLKNARNRRDLYHVGTALLLATTMATSSLGGALLFLLAWAVLRVLGHG